MCRSHLSSLLGSPRRASLHQRTGTEPSAQPDTVQAALPVPVTLPRAVASVTSSGRIMVGAAGIEPATPPV